MKKEDFESLQRGMAEAKANAAGAGEGFVGSNMADNPHKGSTLDSFLAEEGVLEDFQAKAIKEVITAQLGRANAD